MADGVNMWGIDDRFGYKIVEEIVKTWEFLSSNLNERDVETLQKRLKYPGAAWRALVETYTPRTEGALMAVLDGIDNFRMSCEEHPVDASLRMELF